jgi:retron-type reverse transcriptase
MKPNIFGYGGFVVQIQNLEESQFIKSKSTKVDRKTIHSSSSPTKLVDDGGEKKSSIKNEESCIKYNQLFKESVYEKAYEQIKSNPGNMTPGSDNETLDGISKEWVKKTIESFKNRKFQFQPSKRIEIPKKNGQMRTLGIPSPRDKVIQKVLLNLFEKAYEKIFLDSSHGFRPKRSCHTAIAKVQQWTGTTWMIEGDIKGYFDNINHHKLAEIKIL